MIPHTLHNTTLQCLLPTGGAHFPTSQISGWSPGFAVANRMSGLTSKLGTLERSKTCALKLQHRKEALCRRTSHVHGLDNLAVEMAVISHSPAQH
jgi:hypothetical protein